LHCIAQHGDYTNIQVGYFGVGFFSVFALSDSPSIESGDRKMTFAWGGSNGERLFAHSESIATNTTANSTAATSTGTTATSGQSWTTLGFPLKHNAEVNIDTYSYSYTCRK
jgi:hypothetical protein